jgi:hypothetical protein
VIATMQDLLVLTRADFERLPDEGRWEVANGVYGNPEIVSRGALRPCAFPGIDIDVEQIWEKK